MKTDAYDFALPDELIAQKPAAQRDQSKLLVVDRSSQRISHHAFSELPQILGPSNLQIFRNNATVLRARIYGKRETGGKVECVLLEPKDDAPLVWECLLKPGRKLPPGTRFRQEGVYTAEVLEKSDESGTAWVHFYPQGLNDVVAIADTCGELPLPPYIQREGPEADDDTRYQTTYADPNKKIAAAAPTAGLHFTQEINDALSSAGHRFHDLTLRVGLGTFRPVKSENIEDHKIHRERYWIEGSTIAARRNSTGTRLAIGTTSVRTVEDALRHAPADLAEGSFSRDADLFIIPPFNYLGVDQLITNFHLPRSTLFGLVAAFLTPQSIDGVDWLKTIYAEAISKKYRFFSYGDAMLII